MIYTCTRSDFNDKTLVYPNEKLHIEQIRIHLNNYRECVRKSNGNLTCNHCNAQLYVHFEQMDKYDGLVFDYSDIVQFIGHKGANDLIDGIIHEICVDWWQPVEHRDRFVDYCIKELNHMFLSRWPLTRLK